MNKEIEICITKGVIECKNVAIIPVSNFNLSSLLCCQVGCGLEFAHEQVDGESPHLHKHPFQYDNAFYGGETRRAITVNPSIHGKRTAAH